MGRAGTGKGQVRRQTACPLMVLATRWRSGRGRRGRCLPSIVLDLDFRVTDRVSHSLGALIGFFSDADLFFHPRLFGHDRFLAVCRDVPRPLLKGVAWHIGAPAIDRPALDGDPLLAQRKTFLCRTFDRVDAHPNVTLLDLALADLQLLLVDGNYLFLSPCSSLRRGARRGLPADIPCSFARVDAGPAGIAPTLGVIVNVDWMTALEHLHDGIVLAGSCSDDQD